MDQQKQPNGGAGKKQPLSTYDRRRFKRGLQRLLRGLMVLLGGATLIMLLLLLILPAFRLKEIHVEGVNEAEAEQIRAELGELIGEELFAVDAERISRDYIFAQKNVTRFGYIKTYDFRRGWSSITIEVQERGPLAVAQYGSSYYLFNDDLLVLSVEEDAERLAGFPMARMPGVSGAAAGRKIAFEKADVDFSYIGELLRTLDARGESARLTEIDVSQKYAISYVLDGRCRIELGGPDRLETKLAMVDRTIAERGESLDEKFLIDVSNGESASYRPWS